MLLLFGYVKEKKKLKTKCVGWQVQVNDNKNGLRLNLVVDISLLQTFLVQVDRAASRSTGNDTLVVETVDLWRQVLAELAVDMVGAEQCRDEDEKVDRDHGEGDNPAYGECLRGELLILVFAARQERTWVALVGTLMEISKRFVSAAVKLI